MRPFQAASADQNLKFWRQCEAEKRFNGFLRQRHICHPNSQQKLLTKRGTRRTVMKRVGRREDSRREREKERERERERANEETAVSDREKNEGERRMKRERRKERNYRMQNQKGRIEFGKMGSGENH